MHLTSFTDFTLRVLLYLGVRREDDPLATIGSIAHAYGISENHLTKVVHHLAKQGYVRTTRGKGGGMQLARPADQINLGEVVRRTEETRPLIECYKDGKPDCLIVPACGLPRLLAQALRAFYAVLDKYTLADLTRSPEDLRCIFDAAAQHQVVKEP